MNSRHMRPAPTRGPVAPVHRGPQALPQQGYAHAPNAALLIDFDNVTMGIRSDLQSELKNLLGSDIVKGKVSVQRAYADWRRYPQYIVPLAESSIDMIMAPAYGSSKKNATDIRLAVDAIELVFTRPEIGTYILLSGDSDFASMVTKLKEYGKYVIGVGIRESSSDLLVMNCDEYYSYNALAGLVKSNDDEPVKHDPWELVSEAIQRMKRNGDVMRSDRLKQVMQEIDATFDEKDLGMAKFSRFCQEAAHRGLITVTKLENGQLEVGPPAERGAGAPGTQPQDTRSAAVGERSVVRDGEEDGEDRGRGRDREDRGPREARDGREPREAREARQPRLEFDPEGELLTGAAIVEEPMPPSPAARPAPAPPAPMVAPRAAQGRDGIGLTGERLTRSEAFDLVRRAVESVVTGDEAASAQRVREQAFTLLGRDSESLSERNFARILRDAHDGDVIDLRRRGDDYEVAMAQQVAPVTEQLTRAEVAAQPVTPAAPPAPRGMGPRGGGARGRAPFGGAKAGPPPAHLLSIGVVDTGAPAAAAVSTPAPVAAARQEASSPPPSAGAARDDDAVRETEDVSAAGAGSAPAERAEPAPRRRGIRGGRAGGRAAKSPAAKAPAAKAAAAKTPAAPAAVPRAAEVAAVPHGTDEAPDTADVPARAGKSRRGGRGRGGRAGASAAGNGAAAAPAALALTPATSAPPTAAAPAAGPAADAGEAAPKRPRRARARKTAARGSAE